MLRISHLSESDKISWDEFLSNAKVDSHCYSWHWREIISKTFGHRPLYLGAFDGSDLRGILPAFVVRSLLFGSSIVSSPYLNGGGILATDGAAEQALLDEIKDQALDYQARFVELRQRDKISLELPARTHKAAMKLKLAPDPEKLFSAFPAKLRSQIRRPTKDGVYVKSDDELGISVAIDDFYRVFSEHMRDLGTPVYPKQLFSSTKHAFREDCKIFVAYLGSAPIAAGFTIRFLQNVEILWASALTRYKQLSANMLVYWEAIKTAAEQGATEFDFGRSSIDAGTYRFKKQWGAEPQQLYWHYAALKGEIPDISPQNRKFKMLVSLWKHLPLPIANSIGPYITKGLP